MTVRHITWIKVASHMRKASQIIGHSTVCSTCLFKLTSNKTAKTTLLALCEGNILVIGGFHSRGADNHYIDVMMTTMASQITSLTVVYSTVYSDTDQRKHQSSASLAFVWGIHRDRWIPRTKGQLRGKCFHLMTSSCAEMMTSICAIWIPPPPHNEIPSTYLWNFA